ncbi:MAG: PatB family C-S lyase [Kiritimatiellaceae bacterium]|nr:PatB family C-S lyase [Kiritimatiellaceae bacterium]
MTEKIVYDFESVHSREGTFAHKYEARKRIFGTADIDPFWLADMDLPTPDFLVEKMRERLDHPVFGYTEQYDQIFESICWWMDSQHAAVIEKKWISLSPSVVTSVSMAIQVMTHPGDSVVVFSPVYGPFFSCAKINGRAVADCSLLVEDGRFEINFDALSSFVEQPDVTLLILCNPHNPGGRVWRDAELVKIARLCAENGVIIFSDEIHCDIVYPPLRHTSMLNVKEGREISIVAHSIGKTFNTGGLQASFAIIPNEMLRKKFRNGLEKAHAGDVNLLGKVVIATAFSPAGAVYKSQLVSYLRENTLLACEKLQALEGADVMVPEATFLVWCDLRQFGPWTEVFRRLTNEAGVGLSAGTFFGPAGEGWVRINCAHPRSQLLPAVDRIVAEFNSL